GHRLLVELARGAGAPASDEYLAWHDYNEHLLALLRTSDPHPVPPVPLAGDLRAEIRALESVAERLGHATDEIAVRSVRAGDPTRRVLLVHGHNVAGKEAVARFLMKLGLEPVVLDEQAGHGRTLIEKLEAHAPVSFAVVLLTADDVGALATDRRHLRPRARQ